MYIAITKHNSTAEGSFAARETFDECVEIVHKHFLSYDFEIKDGRLYDSGHEDDKDPNQKRAFDCFDNIKMHNGKVAEFMHCGGDGPVGEIRESE